MSYKIDLAAKAPLVGYPVLIAAAIVNGGFAGDAKTIDYQFVDAPLVDKANTDSSVVLELPEGKVYGTEKVLEVLGSKYKKELYKLADESQAKEWINFAFTTLTVKDFKSLTPALEKLEAHLNFRSFLVGYGQSIAEIAVWGVLRANPVVASAVKSGTFINVGRWYKHFEECQFYGGAVTAFTAQVNESRKAGKAGQKKEAAKASFDIDLVGAEMGKVVTRFPPEPSGYLHIGHAKAAILNQYFAKMYKGKLIVRFDDTNPTKEKVEFEESIMEDLELLGIHGDKTTHSSDYFQEMYDLCVKMIKEGKAYADDTPQEVMREQRMDGIASARRDRPVEESLDIFTKEMAQGTEVGVKYCIRAKISVDAPNKAMRDPVLYRCSVETPHHRTGTTWKAYPTYDFCVPVVDSIEGVTHALRTTEYRDRNPQYEWIQEALGIRKVHIWDFSRVNFVRTLLSKRKLQWFVDSGKVSGWDDPRFPTVRGVRRRGMTVEALHQFIIAQGPSKNILNLDWSLIWATNKKVIDPIVPRYSAVVADKAVPITLAGGPAAPVKEQRPKHKKNADLGNKPVVLASRVLIDQEDAVTLKDGEEFTLMDWGNAIVTAIHRDSDNSVKSIDAKLHLEGDFRKTEKKLSWLSDTEDVTPVELVDFDHLITKEKLEEGDKFEDFLTPHTEFHKKAVGDLNIRDLKQGDIIQFERKGYYRLDVAYGPNQPAVFFTIPDGKVVQRYGAKQQ